MKLKKLIGLSLATVMAATGFALASCDDPDNSGKGGVKTYTMEAEYIDLDDIQGSGISSDQGGVEMIWGEGDQEDKDKGWSNGYFVGFTYNANLQLDFVFNADKAATATIVLRLGSELDNLNLDPSTFEVQLNGESISYSSMTIAKSEFDSMKFYDKTVSTNANLKQGSNTISLIVRENTFAGAKTGGPCVDCIKITTVAGLTWTDKTENPDNRGAI